MNTPSSLSTKRLLLQPLALSDNHFIIQLLNTEGWIKFIGNRHIQTELEANAYINRIVNNKNITYWTVKIKETEEAIGVVTFIQRDYLDHPDIGFAFLPNHCGKGYAFEAASAVLHAIIQQQKLPYILATTIPENETSIKLLIKLGLIFQKEMEVETELLHLYSAATDTLNMYTE